MAKFIKKCFFKYLLSVIYIKSKIVNNDVTYNPLHTSYTNSIYLYKYLWKLVKPKNQRPVSGTIFIDPWQPGSKLTLSQRLHTIKNPEIPQNKKPWKNYSLLEKRIHVHKKFNNFILICFSAIKINSFVAYLIYTSTNAKHVSLKRGVSSNLWRHFVNYLWRK